MNFHIKIEREDDGRWIAEVPEILGVLAYGVSQQEAMGKAQALALRTRAIWLDEAHRRADEIDAGKVSLVSSEQLDQQVQALFK